MSAALTRKELATLMLDTIDRLHVMVDGVDHDTWEHGMSWYPKANAYARQLSDTYDIPFAYVAGIIAALSPRIQWEVNQVDAESILADGEQGPNVVKALWIADGTDPDVELGGRKVRSFWHNIAEPNNSLDVTLDGWMAGLLGHDPKFLERKGVYDAISDGFRIVAAEHGIFPHQLQATLWIAATGKAN